MKFLGKTLFACAMSLLTLFLGLKMFKTMNSQSAPKVTIETSSIDKHQEILDEMKKLKRTLASLQSQRKKETLSCDKSDSYFQCVRDHRNKWDMSCMEKIDQEVSSSFSSSNTEPDQYTKIEEEILEVKVVPLKDMDLCLFDRAEIERLCLKEVCDEK